MSLVSEIQVLERPERYTLTVRLRTSAEQLPMHIGQSYGRIAAYLSECGVHPADIPFVAYHNMDMADLDVEIGFVIPRDLPDRDDMKCLKLKYGNALFAVYQGPYQEMKAAYDEIGKFIEENGLIPTGVAYEYYYNEPETPPDKLLTRIEFMLK